MSKRRKKKALDIVKAVKAKIREEEIKEHGKSVIFKTTVVPSKKKYVRKKFRRPDEND